MTDNQHHAPSARDLYELKLTGEYGLPVGAAKAIADLRDGVPD